VAENADLPSTWVDTCPTTSETHRNPRPVRIRTMPGNRDVDEGGEKRNRGLRVTARTIISVNAIQTLVLMAPDLHRSVGMSNGRVAGVRSTNAGHRRTPPTWAILQYHGPGEVAGGPDRISNEVSENPLPPKPISHVFVLGLNRP